MSFLAAFARDAGILLLVTGPVVYLAWRKGRKQTARRLLIAAVSVALSAAVVAVTSATLVEQCESAPGIDPKDCIDFGSAGMRLVMIAAYAGVVWVKGFLMLDE